MSTRTRTQAKKHTATENPAAPTPNTPAPTREPRAELPTRPHPTTGDWMTDLQGYATLHALLADITTPHIQDWTDHGDNTTTRPHNNGHLHYTHHTRQLTWTATCPQGAHHTYPLNGPGDLDTAEHRLGTCRDPHITLADVQTLAMALTPDRVFGDTLTTSTNTTAETQPMPLNQIAAALADKAREHPDPE